VVGAVDQGDLDVDDRAAGQHPVGEGFGDPFSTGLMYSLGIEPRRSWRRTRIPCPAPGPQLQLHVAVLTVAAGLADEPPGAVAGMVMVSR